MVLQQGHATYAALPVVSALATQATFDRLEAIFLSATPQQVLDGLDWYAARHRHMALLAALSGLDIRIVACATSALSARTRWDRNEAAIDAHIAAFVRGETDCPHTQGFGTLFHANDVKAWEILHAGSVDAAYGLLGKGYKTLAFAPAMLTRSALPGAKPVVIDSVAYQAGTGTVPQKIAPKEYEALCDAYVALAHKYRVTPDEAQAIVWGVFRGSFN